MLLYVIALFGYIDQGPEIACLRPNLELFALHGRVIGMRGRGASTVVTVLLILVRRLWIDEMLH